MGNEANEHTISWRICGVTMVTFWHAFPFIFFHWFIGPDCELNGLILSLPLYRNWGKDDLSLLKTVENHVLSLRYTYKALGINVSFLWNPWVRNWEGRNGLSTKREKYHVILYFLHKMGRKFRRGLFLGLVQRVYLWTWVDQGDLGFCYRLGELKPHLRLFWFLVHVIGKAELSNNLLCQRIRKPFIWRIHPLIIL